MKTILLILLSSSLLLVSAQSSNDYDDYYKEETNIEEETYNRKHASDFMYRKGIIRAVDLREKQNKPFFARGHEISAFIIEAIRTGKLTPYTSDSLDKGDEQTIEEFNHTLLLPNFEEEKDTAYMTEEEKEDYILSLQNQTDNFYFPNDIYQMEISEDILFDKNQSVLEYDIKALTFFIPADHPDNIKGIQTPLVSVDYKECKELFAASPSAIWYNPKNDHQHKNLADAFQLRLFSSYIIKVSNPDDEYLMDVYGYGKKGIIASQKAAMDILEFESNLWEN